MTDTPPEQPQTDVSGTGTSAETVDEMAQRLADAKIRSTLSDWEQQLNARMSEAAQAFTSQQESLQQQLQALQAQLAGLRQQAGPPEAQLVAESLAQRVQSIADANPDLGKLHFAGVADQAQRLAGAVRAVADGSGDPAEAERLAGAVASFYERAHPRKSGKFLEGYHEVLNEAERVLELLPDLAPAAGAIVKAL